MSELLGKVVVVTQMKKIPTACAYCKYYENATRGIRVSKERLDNCPLRLIRGG